MRAPGAIFLGACAVVALVARRWGYDFDDVRDWGLGLLLLAIPVLLILHLTGVTSDW